MLNLSNVVWATFIIIKITFCQNYGLPSGDVCWDFTANPNSEFAKDCYQNLDECQQVMQLLRKGIGCDPECGERERCVMVHGKLQCNCTKGFQGKDCSIKIVCANQSAPDNGQVTCDDGENLNSTCTFNCDVGYRLVRNHTTTCIDDNNGDALGIWNNETPTCREISCMKLENLPNGNIECTDANMYASNCSFICDQDLFLNGSNFANCSQDLGSTTGGSWSSPLPQCIKNFIELDDGWVSPFNGFQYKYLRARQNWPTARATCHSMGGDLASFGIRNIETRRILVNALNIDQSVWIGLNDISSEGTWKYITSFPSNDGDVATRSTALWGPEEPVDYNDGCAVMFYSSKLCYVFSCNRKSFFFLCEKPV